MPLTQLEKRRIWAEERERFKSRMFYRLRLEFVRFLLAVLIILGMIGMIYWNFMRPESMIFSHVQFPTYQPKNAIH